MTSRRLCGSVTVAIAVLALLACARPTWPEPAIAVTNTDAGQPVSPTIDGSVLAQVPDTGTPDYAEPFDVAGGYAVPICASACANLLRHTCPEGQHRPCEDSCYIVCKRAEGTRGRLDFKPRCVTAAADKAAIRACGTYRCM